MSNDLPDFSYAVLPTDKSIILIKRGESGYFPSKEDTKGEKAQERADLLNANIGVSKTQALAMQHGSMFGWDVPAADPKTWEKFVK